MKNSLAAAFLAVAASSAFSQATPYAPSPGCKSRKKAGTMAKAKAKKKMADASRRRNRK